MGVPFAAGILAFFQGLAGRFATNAIIRFLALKTLLSMLFMVTLPTAIYAAISWVFSELLSVASAQLESAVGGAGLSPVTLVGCLGFLAYYLRIPEVFSIIISAFIVRITLSFIPFVGGKI